MLHHEYTNENLTKVKIFHKNFKIIQDKTKKAKFVPLSPSLPIFNENPWKIQATKTNPLSAAISNQTQRPNPSTQTKLHKQNWPSIMDSTIEDRNWMKKGDFLGFTMNDLNFLYMRNITFF